VKRVRQTQISTQRARPDKVPIAKVFANGAMGVLAHASVLAGLTMQHAVAIIKSRGGAVW
jgi:hypothetical protein